MKRTIKKMTRIFHPIGQGAFYTEEFHDEPFTMVYDCGSYSNKDLLEKIVKKNIATSVIDLLVISHFHADHINGLEYLFKNYKIKNIMLPLLHSVEKIAVYLYNVKNNASPFMQDLCLNPEKTIRAAAKLEDTNIVYVSSEIGNKSIIKVEDLSNSIIIKSGDIILYTHPSFVKDWHYVPFNFDYKKRSIDLVKLFNKEGIPLDTDGFIKFYKVDRRKVIDVYKQIKEDRNTNSLVLYSGVSNNIKTVKCSGYYSRGYKPEKFSMKHNKVGCLYLGDYNAKHENKWKEFDKAFDTYFKDISTIQIPHHGSKDNYNERLNIKNNILSVMSAGEDRKHHPHPDVLKKILLNNGIPILVTEKAPSIFIQKISLYL